MVTKHYSNLLFGGIVVSLNASTEMYLESIYVLSKSKASVRSIDIAEYLDFSKASVSRAVGILKNDGYISVDGEGYITLTKSGQEYGSKIFERHTVLTEILKDLGVSESVAVENACRIEHVIDDEVFEVIKKNYNKFK